MEHPPKQGLKRKRNQRCSLHDQGFNGTSTKTRIETRNNRRIGELFYFVLMEHPPKQGLKPVNQKTFENLNRMF